jgi:AmmeMemoRadiSam system protein B
MATVRPAAAAGTFYPSDPDELLSYVGKLLRSERRPDVDIYPAMVIVPHAGYVYSGRFAATAYRLLQTTHRHQRVVLVGPSHFERFIGVATPGVDAMATPLGLVDVDLELSAAAEAFDVVVRAPAAHAREHSIEVQLPFLQVALDRFTVLPLVTGDVTPEAVADVVDHMLDLPDVVAIISSDLSHYLDETAARRRDTGTAEAITGLRPHDLAWDDACGRIAVQASLLVALRRRWHCRLLALGNSADTAGSPERVVGYGAFALGPRT